MLNRWSVSEPIVLAKWVGHNAGAWFSPYRVRFSNRKQLFSGKNSTGGCVNSRSVIGARRIALQMSQVIIDQRRDSDIRKEIAKSQEWVSTRKCHQCPFLLENIRAQLVCILPSVEASYPLPICSLPRCLFHLERSSQVTSRMTSQSSCLL